MTRTSKIFLAFASLATMAMTLVPRAEAQASATALDFVRVYYIPIPEQTAYDVAKAIHNGVSEPIRSRAQLVVSVTNTIVYFDHWEDGYEANLFSPTQTTSGVWGDGIISNGVAPGTTNDIIIPGRTVTLTNEVALPRDPSLILYDARDRLASTLPISLVRELNCKDPGEALSGAVNVYPTQMYGFRFVAPVGTNTDVSSKMFQLATMTVMAAEDTTLIEIDADGDDVAERLELLNRGESLAVSDMKAGGSIQSSKPVQAYYMTGAISASYQMRWFTLLPDNLWGNEYFTAVGTSGGRVARIYFHNPNSSAIAVRIETLVGSGTVGVPARSTTGFNMPANTGARIYTLGSEKFVAAEIYDYGSHAYDWGHSLFPLPLLTEQALISWGPGSSANTVDGSPIWVAPVSNTTLYVDYDGDPTTGPLTDPSGNKYNFATNVVRYGMHRIFDLTDNDQTSMRLYTLNKVKICTVWGQDAASSSAGNPYLDMGYAVLPTPLLIPAKASALFYDANGDTLISPGDTLSYTVKVTRVGVPDTNAVYVTDSLSPYLTYVTNSARINGTNITDDVVPPAGTPFPFDENGYALGTVQVGQSFVMTYQALISSSFPSNLEGVINIAKVGGQEYILFTPIQRGSIIGGSVRSDRLGMGNILDPGNPGIPGVRIRLFTDPNGDGDPSDGVAIQTNLTGVVGNFFFNSVPPGNYVLEETDPSFYFSTSDSDPPNDNRIAITVVQDLDSVGHIFLDAVSGLSIEKTAFPPGIWFPELQATFRIHIANTGVVYHTNIVVSDPMLRGLIYVTNSSVVLYDGFVTNTVLDNFSSASYSANNGNEDWAGPWIETDCSGAGPSAGQVRITGGELRINSSGSGCPGSGTAAEIMRNADLVGYYSSTFRYNYRTTGTEADDTIYVQVSTNAANWVTLATYSGTVSGAASHDITPFISDSDTWIRFVAQSNKYTGNDDFFFVDNAAIDSLEVVSIPAVGSPPATMLSGASLFPGGTIDIYFNAIVSNGVSGLTNIACVTSHIVSNALCSTLVKTVDTSAVPDRIGARLVNDLNGSGTADTGERGIRGAPIELWSDPNGDGSPADGVLLLTRITDIEGYVLFGGLSAANYVLVQNDLSGFASTGDSTPPNDGIIPVNLPGGVDSLTNLFLDWTISGLDVQKLSSETTDLIPNQDLVYTIIVSNTRVAAQGNMRVTDTFITDMTYIPGSAVVTFYRPIETNNVADRVGSASYTNSSGSLNWQGPWTEYNDDTLPQSGDIGVVDDMSSYRLKLSDDDSALTRVLPDMTEYHTAELSFTYRRFSLEDGEYMAVSLSTNSAGPWTEVGQIGHSGLGFTTDLFYRDTNYNISAFISPETYLRFSTPTGGMANGDIIYVDDVTVKLTKGGISTQACDPPPVMLDGYEIQPSEAVIITLSAVAGIGDYAVNQVRVTSAGDPAGLYASASNNISSAVLTQGVITADGNANLAWVPVTNAAGQVTRGYDLIHADSQDGMTPDLTNMWDYIATYTNSHGVDGKQLTNAANKMRFYRVSFPNRWTTDQTPRYASAEMYVGKPIHLNEGENWISLFMAPDTNTLMNLFGPNHLPSGPDMWSSARIEWFNATPEANPTNTVWLSDSGHWLYSGGGLADDMEVPLHQGFNLILPPGSGQRVLPVIGRLPTTNLPPDRIGRRIPIKTGKAFNIASYPLPVRIPLGQSGLREAGFKGVAPGKPFNPRYSDEIRILTRGGGAMEQPVVRILMNSSGQFQYWTGGAGSAENHPLEADDAIIIYSNVSTNDYEWDIDIPYDMPTLFMNP